jgi:sugar-specific transcriptional regulator TrmB
MIDLTAAGLSATEAKCYTALLDKKEWKPSDLAKSVNETRTNCYKILDNLVSLGLAERFDKDKKLHYRATNPSNLLQLARERRTAQEKAEKELETNTHDLLASYYKVHEQPGVRFFQGQEGIKQIFSDMLTPGQEIYLVRSPADVAFYDEAFFNDIKRQKKELGITTYAITPDVPSANHDPAADAAYDFLRTWIPAGAYTASVEWNIYGNKVALISYGTEAMGMIIESPQIAESFRQILKLLGHTLENGVASK